MALRVRRSLHLAALRLGSQSGAVSTEYGILLSFIAIVIVAALTSLGIAIARLFERGNAFP